MEISEIELTTKNISKNIISSIIIPIKYYYLRNY